MTHSYKIHFFHFIWSTKDRKGLILPEIQTNLYSYMAEIVKKQGGKILEIGGMTDHVHLLIELNNLDHFSYLIRDVKASSSLWVHKNFPELKDFAWQEGYGSFSVSYSSLENVRKYIQNQHKHHAIISFEEEYLKFLKSNQVKYDERFVFG